MKVMVMVKATQDSEAGVMPGEKLLADMGDFNEQLVKAGALLTGEGLHPFGAELTPELREQEKRVTEQAAENIRLAMEVQKKRGSNS